MWLVFIHRSKKRLLAEFFWRRRAQLRSQGDRMLISPFTVHRGKDQNNDFRFSIMSKNNLSEFSLDDPMIIWQWEVIITCTFINAPSIQWAFHRWIAQKNTDKYRDINNWIPLRTLAITLIRASKELQLLQNPPMISIQLHEFNHVKSIINFSFD